MAELSKCPSCGGRLVLNPSTGEYVCTSCGLVYGDRIAYSAELNLSPKRREALERWEREVLRRAPKGGRLEYLQLIHGPKRRREVGAVKRLVAEGLKSMGMAVAAEELLGRDFKNFQQLEDYLAVQLPELPLPDLKELLKEAYSKLGISRKPKPSREALVKRTARRARKAVAGDGDGVVVKWVEPKRLSGELAKVFHLLRSTGLFSGTHPELLELAVLRAYEGKGMGEARLRKLKRRMRIKGKLSTALRKIRALRSLPAPILKRRFGLTLKEAALIKGISVGTAKNEEMEFKRRFPGFESVDAESLARIYRSYGRYRKVCELLGLDPLPEEIFRRMKPQKGSFPNWEIYEVDFFGKIVRIVVVKWPYLIRPRESDKLLPPRKIYVLRPPGPCLRRPNDNAKRLLPPPSPWLQVNRRRTSRTGS